MMTLEKEIQTFTLNYSFKNDNKEVEVHEIDMDGWILFECFMQPCNSLIQIVFDLDTQTFQCLDINAEDDEEHALFLSEKVMQYKFNGRSMN